MAYRSRIRARWALTPAAAPEANGAPPEPERPWLRHPDESAKAHAAFRYYRDLGAARSQEKVCKKYVVTRSIVDRWSTAHAWVLRARLWDEHQDRVTVALNTDSTPTPTGPSHPTPTPPSSI